MSNPTPGTPGWHPDPTGAHELRWFDGTGFTDQVADGGVQSTDPMPAAGGPAGPAGPGGPAPADTAPAGAPPAAPASSGGGGSKVPIIVAIAAVVVLGVAAFLVFGGDDGGGSGDGTFEDEVAEDGAVVHKISVPSRSLAVIEVDPARDFDVVVAIGVSEDDADRLQDMFEDTPFGSGDTADFDEVFDDVDPDDVDGLPDDIEIIAFRDSNFGGEAESIFIGAPFGFDATVIVAGFGGEEGDYEAEISFADVDVDGDADGEEFLEAIVESDDVPRSIRQEVEDALEFG